jgi:hypothetical protein
MLFLLMGKLTLLLFLHRVAVGCVTYVAGKVAMIANITYRPLLLPKRNFTH